jgi:hypothetical protein
MDNCFGSALVDTVMKFTTLHKLSDAIGSRRYRVAARLINKALETEPGPSWQTHLGRLEKFLRSHSKKPFATIHAKGNGKLPFLAFSVLPGITCPGAGDCLDWCYSFRSWRYPAAFVRQAQNTVLMFSNKWAILADLDRHKPAAGAIDFRLYVDGDFDSVETVNFWFDALSDRSWIMSYGYSKSSDELLAATSPWPANYRLNVSSGSKHSVLTQKRVTALPGARGRFIAVNLGRPVKNADHGDRLHQKELRQVHLDNTGRKAFTCPGQCGDCTPAGHACGSSKFNNIDIIIAAH